MRPWFFVIGKEVDLKIDPNTDVFAIFPFAKSAKQWIKDQPNSDNFRIAVASVIACQSKNWKEI